MVAKFQEKSVASASLFFYFSDEGNRFLPTFGINFSKYSASNLGRA
jgi:hypothetical protein